MSNFNLQQKIAYLLKQHKLVLLRICASQWQEQFITGWTMGRTVVDLSDPLLRERATCQPQEFLGKLAKPVLIRNLQYVPELYAYLTVDDVPNGSYLAVVGLDYYLMEAVTSAQGVVVELPLRPHECEPFHPCTEYLHKLEGRDVSGRLLHSIIQGELSAESFADDGAKAKFYLQYVKDYIQREIKDLTTVSDDMKFYRFLCAAATGCASMVNYANLGKAADISSPTAKQWMSFLVGMGVVHFLWPIENASLKRVAKAPKLYFTDTGLAAYLLRINSTEELSESAFFGALYDNYVVNTIKNSYLANGFDVDLSYFRDSNAKEISLLLRYNDIVYPIEIKKDPFVTSRVLKKLKLLDAMEEGGALKIGMGCVIGLGKKVEQLADKLYYIPAGSL